MVLVRLKEAYSLWLLVQRDIPKSERYGLGHKIDTAFLTTLEHLFLAAYAPLHKKVECLTKTSSELDVLKFFLQLGWEQKRIPHEKYAALAAHTEEVGRMLGGWRRGLLSKTPPTSGGGEKR